MIVAAGEEVVRQSLLDEIEKVVVAPEVETAMKLVVERLCTEAALRADSAMPARPASPFKAAAPLDSARFCRVVSL